MSAGQQEQEKDIELALHRILDYLRQDLFFQNACPKDSARPKPCDLSELALAGINLARRSLPNLIAVKTILSDAVLSGIDLSNAKLNSAILTRAELTGAELTGAELTYAELSYAKLGYAKLTRAELSYAKLNGAMLNGAELTRAVLTCAELIYAKLDGAKLNEAELNYANLIGAKLGYAKLIGAKLDYAKLNGAELNYADLIGAELNGAALSGADVSGTKFTLLPSILTANFSNTKNSDTAEFYTEDGVRVTGVTIGVDGHLVPAAEDPSAATEPAQKFGAAAQDAVAFKEIYPALLTEAREKGYLVKNPEQEAGSYSDPSATPS